MSKLFMETTQISARKTAGEVQELLGEAGARRVMMEFGAGHGIESLSFTLLVASREIAFRLPIRVAAIQAVMEQSVGSRPRRGWKERIQEQAERVAWRQIYHWLKAQLALIQTGMVQPAEVFMPYAQLASGQTVFEELAANGFKALPSPKKGGE